MTRLLSNELRMQYAIVDIETTGSVAREGAITEIAVFVSDGKMISKQYETLLNPMSEIPKSIVKLTGISNEMVQHAPVFSEIASDLYHLLHDKIFIAHNVNFDYTFLKNAFAIQGLQFQVQRLCSAQLARKAFPGHQSYSLGKICADLGIQIENRHRAGGDAEATAKLFHLCLEKLGEKAFEKLIVKRNKNIDLPPNIKKEEIDKLPVTAGVYFFKNRQNQFLYIGKANQIKKRVLQHFGIQTGKSFLQLEEINSVEYQECGNELMSLLIENEFIHQHWPKWNVLSRYGTAQYTIQEYLVGNGELRINAIKLGKYSIVRNKVFPSLSIARNKLHQLIQEVAACSSLSFSNVTCELEECYCKWHPSARLKKHNELIAQAIELLNAENALIWIEGKGRTFDEKSIIKIENNLVKSWGFFHVYATDSEINAALPQKKQLPENNSIVKNILQKASKGKWGEYKLYTPNLDFALASESLTQFATNKNNKKTTNNKNHENILKGKHKTAQTQN